MTRLVSIIAFLLPALASARSTVLRVDKTLIYVDLGAADGVKEGMELRLYHAIVATHPVTKKKVRDTFYLGNLTVQKTGQHLAIAAAAEDLLPRVTAGDEVELAGRAQVVVDPWRARLDAGSGSEEPEDIEVAPGEDPDRKRILVERERARAQAQAQVDAAAAARVAWSKTLGKPIAERVDVWTAYLNENPTSPYAGTVRAEIASLEAQERLDTALDARKAGGGDRAPGGALAATYLMSSEVTLLEPLAYTPPARVYEGAAFELAALVVRPGAVKAAWVHYRRAGDSTYRSLEMTLGGDGYLRARLPGHDVRPPAVEYFVEVLDPEGEAPYAVIGAAGAPSRVAIDASVAEPPRDIRHRSRITLIADYVIFDQRNQLDYYYNLEADFMYRFRRPVYAMRLGFATMHGHGGPKDVINRAEDTGGPPCEDAGGVYRCKKVAFNYAYVELELKATEVVSLMVRGLYGSVAEESQGLGTVYEDRIGARLRARLGDEQATNLAASIGVVEGFGNIFEAAFTWDVIPQFPIVLSAQLTDQPVQQEYGVRLIGDVGWRGISWLYPSLRLSYNVRDINHAGASFGGALNFDW